MELYKKVIVNSENDLPKEVGWYFCKPKDDYGCQVLFNPENKDLSEEWVNVVDYYLQPIEQPEIQLPTDEEIEEKASGIANPESKKDFARGEWLGVKEGAKWMRSEILRRNES